MQVRSTLAALAVVAFLSPLARGDDVTTTRAWTNCEGGEGVWSDMRISGCNEVIKSGKAEGETLAHAYYSRGNALLQKSEYRKAIEDYSQALKLKADDSNALHERCWSRAVLNVDLEDALSDCNRSLRLKPNDPETLGGRAFLYMRLSFFKTAILDYDAALEVDPKNALLLYGRGVAKANAGDVEGGEADAAAARALDAKVEETFARYEAGENRGMWATFADYWRAALRWLY